MGLLRPYIGIALFVLLLCDQIVRAPFIFFSIFSDIQYLLTGFREKNIETAMHYLSAIEAGQGMRVVFLHEEGGDRHSWRYVAPQLVEYGSVSIIELAHHGGSTSFKEGYYSVMEESLNIHLREEEEEIVLVASGLGARLALEAARLEPSKIEALVLLSPVGIDIRNHDWTILLPKESAQMQRKTKEVFGEALPHFWLESLLNRFKIRDADFKELQHLSPLDDVLSLVEQPIYVFVGEGDRLTSLDDIAHLPNGQLYTQPNCGYAVQYACPEGVVSFLQGYLKGNITVPEP